MSQTCYLRVSDISSKVAIIQRFLRQKQIQNQKLIMLQRQSNYINTCFPNNYFLCNFYLMAQKNQTALQKMQEIANRLISNTPQLVQMLEYDSLLKPKLSEPNYKKNKLGQMSHGIGNISKNQMTSNDYYQKCKELNQEVVTYKQKCAGLQEQINIIKQRFVQRQIQYRKIIQQLQDELKSKSVLDSSDRNRMQQINQLHKQIIDNISSIQNKTSKILIEQQSDIRRFFHKKINQIKQKFKEDKINKTQKDQEYQQKQKQMMSELDWIKNIAHKIDMENQTMMKKYTTLKSEFDIQEKDKQILLKQLLMKKKQNAVLKSQVDQYEKLLNQVSREMDQQTKQDLHLNTSQIGSGNKSKQQVLQPIADSRISNNNSINDKRYQNSVSHLKSVIAKEKKKVRDLKNLYMKEVGNKSQLQKIIRKLVDDIRQSVVQIEKDRKRKKNQEDQFSAQAREQLLQKILSNQKILTMVYDKAFYSQSQAPKNNYNQKVPQQIQRILEDDQEGFS